MNDWKETDILDSFIARAFLDAVTAGNIRTGAKIEGSLVHFACHTQAVERTV